MSRLLGMVLLLLAFVASRDAVQILLAQPHVCDDVVSIDCAGEDESCGACDQAADPDNDDDVYASSDVVVPELARLSMSVAAPVLSGASAPEPGLRPPV
ncbi:MAG: hypothetical protein QM723_37010 [Myxococcaceae bacterium]